MTTATTLLLLALARVPADAEVAIVSTALGVDPVVALAVAEVESGNVPPERRDTVVSPTGDVGRFQINSRTWTRRLGYRSPAAFTVAMQNRHANILTAAIIMRRIEFKYATEDREVCRCGNHNGGPMSHYNEGVEITAKGEAYGLRVLSKVHRMLYEGFNGRRW